MCMVTIKLKLMKKQWQFVTDDCFSKMSVGCQRRRVRNYTITIACTEEEMYRMHSYWKWPGLGLRRFGQDWQECQICYAVSELKNTVQIIVCPYKFSRRLIKISVHVSGIYLVCFKTWKYFGKGNHTRWE